MKRNIAIIALLLVIAFLLAHIVAEHGFEATSPDKPAPHKAERSDAATPTPAKHQDGEPQIGVSSTGNKCTSCAPQPATPPAILDRIERQGGKHTMHSVDADEPHAHKPHHGMHKLPDTGGQGFDGG